MLVVELKTTILSKADSCSDNAKVFGNLKVKCRCYISYTFFLREIESCNTFCQMVEVKSAHVVNESGQSLYFSLC